MINNQLFEEIMHFAENVTYNSLIYSEYEDIKESECLVNEENLKILYNQKGVQPIIEYVSEGLSPLFNYLKNNPIKGALHFVPKEAVPSFESIGFQILGQYADFICNPLVDLYPNEVYSFEFAKSSDCEILEKISQSCKLQNRGFFGETKEWFQEWLEENKILIIKDKESIIGFACVSIYNEGTTLWVREVCVDPSHQKSGFGVELMKQAVRYGLSEGAVKGFLAVDIENMRAINIYNSFGFKRRNETVETQLIR